MKEWNIIKMVKRKRQERIPSDIPYCFISYVSCFEVPSFDCSIFRVNVLPQWHDRMEWGYAPQNANENLETLLLVYSRP